MREVDTNALLFVAKQLGVSNPATLVEAVNFDDAVLQQVLDVRWAIRRARAIPVPSEGITNLLFQVSAAGAGTNSITISPYQLTPSGVPFPDVNEAEDLDLWVTGAQVRTATTGVTTAGFLAINGLLSGNGGANTFRGIAAFGSTELSIGGTNLLLEAGTGQAFPVFAPMRIPRTATLIASFTSTAAETYTAELHIGAFPRSLGQDAVGGA